MPRRLLIIDDNDIDRMGLTGLLSRAGFEVAAAKDAQEARQHAQTDRPDLILLDMMMPIHDGWDFLEWRREDDRLRDIPVIVVTGLSVASEKWAQDLGGQALVKKPINTHTLFGKIRGIIGGDADAAGAGKR